MNRINKSITSSFAILAPIFFLLLCPENFAKTAAKKERTRLKTYYFKEADGNRKISIALTAGSGKKMHGVKNGTVELTATLNDSTINLAVIETDTLGEAELYLASNYVLPMDEDGKCFLEVSYNGNDTYRSASRSLEIIDIDLEFEFRVEDSVKYLGVIANRINAEGEKAPVEELSIDIGVERLFSVLPIGEMETDEDGFAELEIPDNIPGDAEGELRFVAKIEDHDEFGTVTKTAENNWGAPVDYTIKPLARQLFTDEAPLWMIIAVFIILLGAWYHFFLSISKLVKLKKAGKAS
ncbi:MAG: hypothetical protein MI975_01445 [Cytophagales bacterium]|nr:hypothetical protein [Cytophagales bacterium]